jgi:hypothetical protein
MRLKQTFDFETITDKITQRFERLLEAQGEDIKELRRQAEEDRKRFLEKLELYKVEDQGRTDE